LLTEVYGLLVQAHYQTTPADLRNLLDQTRLLLFAQKTNQTLTGAALVAIEGEIPNELHRPIMQKQRRLADQILPQLLAQSSGEANGLNERFARIVRIAIHPAIQQQGFGTRLFAQLEKQLCSDTANLNGVNSIGVSFGADRLTLSFWLKQGLKPVHYGYKVNPRSALRSACLINSSHRPISQSIEKAGRILRANTKAQLSINDNHDPVQTQLLGAIDSQHRQSLTSIEIKRLIHDYCQAHRSFMDSVGLLSSAEFFTEFDEVQTLVQHTLEGYRQMSPNTRRATEAQLRTALIATGLFAEFD